MMPRAFCLLLPILLLAGLFLASDLEKSIGGRNESYREKLSGETHVPKADSVRLERETSAPTIDPDRIESEVRTIVGQIDDRLLNGLEDGEKRLLTDYVRQLLGAGGGERFWCWAGETRADKVSAFATAERLVRRGKAAPVSPAATRFLPGGRWGRTALDGTDFSGQGDPVLLTWSVVPDGTPVTGTSGVASRGSDLRSWMASVYGSNSENLEEQAWFEIFKEAFDLMGATCGVRFQYEPNDDGASFGLRPRGIPGVRGDIRIGARFLDGDSGVLGISLGPDSGDMVLDSGDGTFELTGGSSLRLVNTLTHEIGHCLGLDHVCPLNRTKLMEPNLTTAFRGPQFDEFQSLQFLYGDRMEWGGGFRDNDSWESASGIPITPGEDQALARLSIDSGNDVDFFALDVLNGQQLEVSLIPGEGVYEEGGEAGENCSGGEIFDSARQQDLKIEIFDIDGRTSLVSRDQVGPGGVEVIEGFEFYRSGRFYLKVSGTDQEVAQLYELRLSLADRLPGPRIVIGEGVVVAESGIVKNGRPDPGETVRVRFPVTNEGTLTSSLLDLAIETPDEVTIFEEAGPPFLAAGETGFIDLVFGAAAECGEAIVLDLVLRDEGEIEASRRSRFSFGEVINPIAIDERFDRGGELPEGWESGGLSGGENWQVLSSRFDTPLRSAFGSGSRSSGESWLISPSFELALRGGTLRFRHLYRMEVGFDGGVLEVSRNGGEWTDLLTGFDLQVTGGYNRTIREGFGSPLAGREAWSARLGTFMSTSVELPERWAGEILRFRWRFGFDRSGTSEGWWVDTVKVEMDVEACTEHQAEIKLRSRGDHLDENRPGETVSLIVESELPLLEPLTIPLNLAGTAGLDDVVGDFVVVLPAGDERLEVPVAVRVDDLEEEDENLVITLPESGDGFAAGPDSEVILGIRDLVTLESWIKRAFRESVDPAGDFDGDGWAEIAEYLLGTDPLDSLSRPGTGLEKRGDQWSIGVGNPPERGDAILGVEGSEDLVTWEPVPFIRTEDGLSVTSAEGALFFRLTFRRVR